MFNETKVWNLLYELVGYKHMTIIIDEDGISIADLDDIDTNPPINAQTPEVALQILVDKYFSEYPFDIMELKLVNYGAYKGAIETEREKINDSLVEGTHRLYKEFEEGVQQFYDIANIKFQLNGGAIYSDEIHVEVYESGEFVNTILPIDKVRNEYFYDWCLDHGLYENGFPMATSNKFCKFITQYFSNFPTTFENSLGSFVDGTFDLGLKDMIEIVEEALCKHYNDLVSELLSDDTIAERLYRQRVEFDSNGNVLELHEL